MLYPNQLNALSIVVEVLKEQNMKKIRIYIKRMFKLLGFEIKQYHPVVLFDPKLDNEFNDSQGNIKVTSFDWARVNQLFDFNSRQIYNFHSLDAENYDVEPELVEKFRWGLKGYGYSVVVDLVRKLHLNMGKKLKILDVGGGGSALPRVLSQEFGDECWLIDDFGVESKDLITQGWYKEISRETLPLKNPTVHYVFGRLGGSKIKELEPSSFDLIYSISTLEHIPMTSMTAVFNHMLELLKPNGIMLHTIDLSPREFPGWRKFLSDYFKTRGIPPAIFQIKNLNELDEIDPPLLESPEIVYTFWDGQPKKYYPQSALVIELHRNG
jgi:ubiquinone/menaquinone biosynthesis C-methylase UbiE